MPLTSASPMRSVAIGAGVGGKVSHRSVAPEGKATKAKKAARTNWRIASQVIGWESSRSFPPFRLSRKREIDAASWTRIDKGLAAENPGVMIVGCAQAP